MTRRLYRRGDRVRILVPTLSGWLGTATVTEDQEPHDPIVDFVKDDAPLGEWCTGYTHWSELKLIEAENGAG